MSLFSTANILQILSPLPFFVTQEVVSACQHRLPAALYIFFVLLVVGILVSYVGNLLKNFLLRERGQEYDQRAYVGFKPDKIMLDFLLDLVNYLNIFFIIIVGGLWGIVIPLFYIDLCPIGPIARPALIYYVSSISITAIVILIYQFMVKRKQVKHAQTKRQKFDEFLDKRAD